MIFSKLAEVDAAADRELRKVGTRIIGNQMVACQEGVLAAWTACGRGKASAISQLRLVFESLGGKK
jgi:hypothetical protein